MQDDLLAKYIHTFFGHGDLAAPIWYVGMEEGGGTDRETLARELAHWDAAGRPVARPRTEDPPDGESRWFRTHRPRIQPTWGKLIRATLTALGQPADIEAVRRYQVDRLTRPGTEMALLELMPLRSRNVRGWPYAELSDLPYLRTRKVYMTEVAHDRETRLCELIAEHTPKAVIFFGEAYRTRWSSVAQVDEWSEEAFGHAARGDGTDYFRVHHPTAHGSTNARFEALGEAMRESRRFP